MAESEPTSGSGIMASLRNLFALAVGVLRNRVELFALELHEEKYRLAEVCLLAGSALFLGLLSLILLTGVVLFLFAEPYRIYVAAGFGVLYMGIAIALCLKAKQRLQTPPFAETINQIRKDSECLTPPK
ncbi:MAG TPA: phage holin family protein [Methylomirabilota bacterium]|jgi:uncharacterized membrane protein YqjE|nr:phage holin family protein [Methylomirabilota bacterium]